MGVFNLSHTHTTTCEMGKMIPVAAQEVLPGDMFRQKTDVLLRTAALKAPVMHPVYMRVHHFFVPNRLVDDQWEDFITGKDGRDATGPTLNLVANSVAGRMGVGIDVGQPVSAHPIRAYNLIYNEWFRDQDLNAAANIDDQQVKSCAWGRDYFTKARPAPQQGAAVTVPVQGGFVDGLYIDNIAPTAVNTKTWDAAGAPGTAGSSNVSPVYVRRDGTLASDDINPVPSGTADGAIDINELRRALFLQQQAEQRQRYGSRYVDLLKQFGVRPQDARLDRPELLGGSSRPISFTEVVATAEGTGVDVGDLYGHGIGVMSGRSWRRMFPEHGWVISILSIVPQTQYIDMVPKGFIRSVPGDYWFPESEIEGPQPILNREVQGAHVSPADTFGWTGRHDEYRSRLSYVSGEMSGALDDWHYARDLNTNAALNGAFVRADVTDRVYQNTTNDPCRVFVSHSIKARRPVSQTPMV